MEKYYIKILKGNSMCPEGTTVEINKDEIEDVLKHGYKIKDKNNSSIEYFYPVILIKEKYQLLSIEHMARSVLTTIMTVGHDSYQSED